MSDKQLDQHDLVVAAAEGQTEDVKTHLRRGLIDPTDARCTRALYLAATNGHVGCARVLLDGKVPTTNEAPDGAPIRSALHAAAEAGNEKVVRLLLERRACVSAVDHLRKTPFELLLAAKPSGLLDVAHDLIRFGAEVPSDANFPGLGAVAKEVRVKLASDQLRDMATFTVDPAALVAIEDQVWIAQREHMRLLARREEQKAGVMLVEREERLKAEIAVASSLEEQAQHGDASARDLQIQDQMLAQDLELVLKEIEPTRLEEAHALAEYDRFGSEIADRRAECRAASSDRDLSHEALAEAVEQEEAAQASHSEMEAQVEQGRVDKDIMKSELETARATLNKWMREKEQAAAFTAQAHKILHN